MADIKKADELHSRGFNCAQVVASLCRDISGADEKTALASMGGFGGGVRCGEICGAVTGGVYSLGLYCPYADGADIEAKAKIAELTKSFTAAFKEKFGTVVCRELIPEDDHSPCVEYMASAAELIHDIIEREKQK